MHRYFVYVTDSDGFVFQHGHSTRAKARAHVQRVNSNIFLRGWSAKGVSSQGVRL